MNVYLNVNYSEEIIEESEDWCESQKFDYQFILSSIKDNDFSYYTSFSLNVDNTQKEFYLVYALYTDGSTFGIEEGNLFIDNLYSSYEDALYAKQELKLKRDHSVPWNNYFAELETIKIEKLELYK